MSPIIFNPYTIVGPIRLRGKKRWQIVTQDGKPKATFFTESAAKAFLREHAPLKGCVQHPLVAWAKKNRCLDCGCLPNKAFMEFDHRDFKEKAFNIGAGKGRTVEELINEIVKCDIVCANCHRIRTHASYKNSEFTKRFSGRPLCTFDVEKAKELISQGVSYVQAGAMLGVSRITVKRRLQDEPQMEAAA